MSKIDKVTGSFVSSPVLFQEDDNKKTLALSIKQTSQPILHGIKSDNTSTFISKSWNDTKKPYRYSNTSLSYSPQNGIQYMNQFNRSKLPSYTSINKPFDAITNCKSAGVIPYTIHHNKIYFLLQHLDNPTKKKDKGWNDFGGKRIGQTETTIAAASREFSEETSCLFYLSEMGDKVSKQMYQSLKNNPTLSYDEQTVNNLEKILPYAQQYYINRIKHNANQLYVSSKETYISYFVKVDYIPDTDIPIAEDIHVNYETRYLRQCKWFSFDEIISMNENDFHKRLQITRIQQRIKNYHDQNLFHI